MFQSTNQVLIWDLTPNLRNKRALTHFVFSCWNSRALQPVTTGWRLSNPNRLLRSQRLFHFHPFPARPHHPACSDPARTFVTINPDQFTYSNPLVHGLHGLFLTIPITGLVTIPQFLIIAENTDGQWQKKSNHLLLIVETIFHNWYCSYWMLLVSLIFYIKFISLASKHHGMSGCQIKWSSRKPNSRVPNHHGPRSTCFVMQEGPPVMFKLVF